ncbi:MAG: adenosylcobalamin-dependent ribonucleoside-diphosphate reductase [Deltaproteobacteria bacterium]|nr:adenosylcobalamin-dependent ribonucleoside-diphosphate reductase [Deltaproteobacteria bacterium]
MELSANARRVLEARYLARREDGRVCEDWEGLVTRVARAVASVEKEWGGDVARREEEFSAAITRGEFLPNSPTLMNAGTPLGQLAACFVLPVEDRLESVFDALKQMAMIHQSGGGTGFSFSSLRPAGDVVQGTAGVASGPVAFMGVFDAATAVVKQGGRRRGANMGVLRVDHPDVVDFIRAKAERGQLSNFNVSLSTPDSFWHAVEAGSDFALVNPRNGRPVRSLDARWLLDEIARFAWATGDPGLLFIDAVNRANPTPQLGPLEATNPCGELPLLPNEACNLGSLRLDAFVRDGRLDWECLERAVDLGVRFLDDVIEASRYPFPAITAIVRGNRKIGLGVMGFADLLVDLGIPYDAPEATALAERLMARIRARAETASARLAEERGAFPNWEGSRQAARGLRLRNATVTSIAPTGTISILAGCAGGIEPFFALAFVRHVLDGARLPETNPRFEAALRRAGAWSEELVARVRAEGSARHLPGVPEPVARLFPSAYDVAPERHLDVQQAFQKHVDNAVSKTVNLPARATPEDVRAIYLSAWRRGLKGVTVFREGSKGAEAVLVRGARGELEVPEHFAGDCSDALCA